MLKSKYLPLLLVLGTTGCSTGVSPCGSDDCRSLAVSTMNAAPATLQETSEINCEACMALGCFGDSTSLPTSVDSEVLSANETHEDKSLGEALLETAEAINEGVQETQKTLAVKSRLASIDTGFHSKLEVVVEANQVTLTGQLATLFDVERAVLACLDAEGIEAVNVAGIIVDELVELLNDSKLNGIVQYRLAQQKELTKGISSVKDDVSVSKGVVNINAEIQNYGQRRKLSKLLKAIPGIKGISISTANTT